MNNVITEELWRKVYTEASPVKKFLCSHYSSGGKLRASAKKFDLDKDEVYKKFAVTVGDIILGFYRIEDTVPLLQQELGIDPKTAALLGAEVLEFLAPLSDPNWQPPIEAENLTDETEIVPASVPADSSPQRIISTPMNSEEKTKTPPATSNSTLHYEPVHTSIGQDSLRQPLSETPSYNQPPENRSAQNHRPDLEPPMRWGQ